MLKPEPRDASNGVRRERKRRDRKGQPYGGEITSDRTHGRDDRKEDHSRGKRKGVKFNTNGHAIRKGPSRRGEADRRILKKGEILPSWRGPSKLDPREQETYLSG